MRKAILLSVLVLASILLSACGGAATPTDTALVDTMNIVVSTNPNPIDTGDVELVFTITDAHGNPIEGAKVDVSADHTDMMGMTMGGPATDQGGGKYAINANFSMSGNWKLTVYVRKDGHEYKEEIEVKVQ